MYLDEKRQGEVTTTADAFQLSTLVAWLETKNPEEKYCYYDQGNCLLGQYFTALGFTNMCMMTTTFYLIGGIRRTLPAYFDDVAHGVYGSPRRWTFGAALDRARKLMSA